MMSEEKPQERGDTNVADAGATGAQFRENNDVSDGIDPDASSYGRGGTRTANTDVTEPNTMEL